MTNKYDAPFKEEILSYGGRNIAVFKALNPDTDETIIEKMYLELVSDIIQDANGITAPQLNNMNGKINSLEELVNQLNMIAELRGDFITNGNDNLELFGISNLTRRGILNNHSDFGVLKEDAAAGVTQIKMINASGYRLSQMVSTTSNAPNNTYHRVKSDVFDNGMVLVYYYGLNSSPITITNPKTKTVVREAGVITSSATSGSFIIDYKHNIYGYFSWGSGTVAILNCFNLNKNVAFSISNIGSEVRLGFYCDIDDYFYFIYPGTPTYNPQLLRSNIKITEDTVSGTGTTNVRTFPQNLWNDGISSFYFVFKPRGVKYAILYARESAHCFMLENNYSTLTKFTIGHGVFSISSLATNNASYLILGRTVNTVYSDRLIKYRRLADGSLDKTDTGTLINVPFLNGRQIMSVWSNNGIYYLSGTDSLFGHSIDGENWTEIVMSDSSKTNAMLIGGGVDSEGNVAVSFYQDSGGTAFYETFDPQSFEGKRYKLNNEFITIETIETEGNDIIATLTEPLKSSHSANESIQRTTDSNIQPNSTQTVCVELQNVYPHNAAAAKPIFTKIENVTIVPEICQRNENDIEEWVNFELVKEDDLKNGWQKNTYYKVYPQSKSVWAIAFTVTNNNETPIELNQLGIGLSNEVYEA